jgi:hypothetical protein
MKESLKIPKGLIEGRTIQWLREIIRKDEQLYTKCYTKN